MRSLFGNLHTPSSFSPLSGHVPGRTARGGGLIWFAICVLAGGLQAASLAWPFAGAWLPGLALGTPSGVLQIASLAMLVLALRHVHRVRQGVWRGWVFATAWLSGTFWWLFVSMNTYGGLPVWLSALAVWALAGFLALYYAVATGLLCTWAPRSRVLQALLFAALWTLAELMRGQWLTGFPWGAGGYAQVDLMTGWAPWIGVYGMGALAALLAYGLAVLVPAVLERLLRGRPATVRGRHPVSVAPVPANRAAGWDRGLGLTALALILASLALGEHGHRLALANTREAGSLEVWLLQGNIPQDEKFVAGTGMAVALDWYPAQVGEAAAGASPRLVVAPETALPLLPQQLDEAFWRSWLQRLSATTDHRLAVLVGLPLGSVESGYANAAWGMTGDTAERALERLNAQGPSALAEAGFYRYDKHHLVPFGEFVPPLFRWFTDLMAIPLGDFSRGPLPQAPWSWGGQRLMPNICYEDLFGEELAAAFRQPGSEPTVLLNLSNIGWFGDTVAIDQHLNISRVRALELGRPMLRATNTGATAAIDHTGRVAHALPRLVRDRLVITVQGREGLTPYARWAGRWGLWPVWGLSLGVVALVLALRRRRRARP